MSDGHILAVDAQVAACHFAVGLQLLSFDGARHIDGDGKADTHVTAALAENGRVDPDDVAVKIDQRAAGVTRIDGRVGLDKVLVSRDMDVASSRQR